MSETYTIRFQYSTPPGVESAVIFRQDNPNVWFKLGPRDLGEGTWTVQTVSGTWQGAFTVAGADKVWLGDQKVEFGQDQGQLAQRRYKWTGRVDQYGMRYEWQLDDSCQGRVNIFRRYTGTPDWHKVGTLDKTNTGATLEIKHVSGSYSVGWSEVQYLIGTAIAILKALEGIPA
ncbi:hypothetical protein K466DRAFT_602383 [Polyporus arcularius HHB13444]|uniref:Uncharacterized protein n=1 Tax=Polyporus arcularius HHB13444 TaxID=1314778 RepID=A0A5C3P2X2_9APHY|nr:hypothetical protein K466DRAFT_602383 [Polyporus arcularius HHB13444]